MIKIFMCVVSGVETLNDLSSGCKYDAQPAMFK